MTETFEQIRQIRPVGADPGIDVLLLGALLWTPHDQAAAALARVTDQDMESPAAGAVLAAIRTLVQAGKPAGPQLVLDELRRHGLVTRPVADRLRDAVTSGAEPMAVMTYAAAAVAANFRRLCASTAIGDAAGTASEADLAVLVERHAATIKNCAERLAALRGAVE